MNKSFLEIHDQYRHDRHQDPRNQRKPHVKREHHNKHEQDIRPVPDYIHKSPRHHYSDLAGIAHNP